MDSVCVHVSGCDRVHVFPVMTRAAALNLRSLQALWWHKVRLRSNLSRSVIVALDVESPEKTSHHNIREGEE